MDGIKLFDGEFWISGTDHERWPGFLKVGPRLAPTLEIIGELTPLMREVERKTDADGKTVVISEPAESDENVDGPFLIHGVDSVGTKLTLLDAVTINRSFGIESKHVLQGIQAVVGVHLANRQHEFSNFRIRIQNLDFWRPFLHKSPDSWESETTLEEGGTVSMTTSYSPRVWLVGRGVKSFNLRGLDRSFERPLVSLFTLATGTPCEVLDIQVQEESSDGRWWDVYTSSLHLDDGTRGSRNSHDWLFGPADLHLHHVGAWLNRVDLLGPLPPGVADIAQGGTISLETQLLQLTTIAEGLHRALFPDECRFDDDASASIREAAINAVREVLPDAVEAVRGLLGHVNEPGYAQRLVRLADEVGSAVPGVTGRTNRWKSLVAGARNDFAHRLKGEFLKSEDVDRYLTVALSLRWLLTGLLLLQADMSPSLMGERFGRYSEYEYFLKAAKQWQPRVYRASE